jgi:hypothetical protein
MTASVAALAVFGLAAPAVMSAQSMDVVGTRAAGMAGAFVGVADDASAAYWNPGGLASGAYVSLVLDGGVAEAIPDPSFRGQKHSSFLLGISMPALGVTYYRLDNTSAHPFQLLLPADGSPPAAPESALPVRVDSLVTHHAGITLVQSVFPGVAVGSTLKLVRGFAGSEPAGFVTADVALDHSDLPSRATNKFDLDVGVMASWRNLKGGVTVRNITEPEFKLPDDVQTVQLDRQARAGMSYVFFPGWLLAADVDLLETADAFGERRDVAFGIEGRVIRRVTVRSGFRINAADAADDLDTGSRHGFAVGGSFAARASMLVDAAAILGGERGDRGWRIGARFVY